MQDQQQQIFARITWIRGLEQDPRVTGGLLDVARVMGVGANRFGFCDLTIRQIQQRLVLRQSDGDFIPPRTIKDWRTRLKRLGYMTNVAPGVGAGFAGPGKGRGGIWQLLGNGQSEASKTGNETGNTIARSTSTPTGSASAAPKEQQVTAATGGQVSALQVDPPSQGGKMVTNDPRISDLVKPVAESESTTTTNLLVAKDDEGDEVSMGSDDYLGLRHHLATGNSAEDHSATEAEIERAKMIERLLETQPALPWTRV